MRQGTSEVFSNAYFVARMPGIGFASHNGVAPQETLLQALR